MNVGFCKNDLYVGPWTGGPWGGYQNWFTCKPILVGVASSISKIWLLFLPSEMPLDHAWGQEIESAQKFHAS